METTLFNRTAERATLGSVLIDPEILHSLRPILKAEDFHEIDNQNVWRAFEHLADGSYSIDALTLDAALERLDLQIPVGYVNQLLGSVESTLNVLDYARIVAEFAKRRAIVEIADRAVKAAMSNTPVTEVLVQVGQDLSEVTGRTDSRRVSPKTAASSAIDTIYNTRRFTTGNETLDHDLKGIFAQRLNTWAGYQGTGKSAFMLQNARRNADLGFKVALFSLEMSPAQMWLRMACGDLRVDISALLADEINDTLKSEVVDRAGMLGDAYEDTISIYEAPMSLYDMKSIVHQERPDIVWVDHSRLISGKPKTMSGVEWAREIPLFLRQEIAKREDCSVNLLQQMSRDASKNNRRPNIHDLYNAGEDDPDTIILMHRTEDPNMAVTQAMIEFIVDKNRFGWTGITPVVFDLEAQKFLKSETKTFKVK